MSNRLDDIVWPTEVRGSARGVGWLNKLLRACKKSAIRDVKFVGGLAKMINGTLVLSSNPSIASPQPSHPFKIYQPTNVSSFTTGVTFLGTDGTPTTCNIDATTPTDFTATPPTCNPKTDAWRFWAVRCGQVEVRFNYTLMRQQRYIGVEPFEDVIDVGTNWGAKYNVQVNTDGHAPVYDEIEFDSPITTVGNRPAAQVLIISGSPSAGLGKILGFGIWIQIAPDTSAAALPTALICGRSVKINTQADSPVPTPSNNVIPVGSVFYVNPDPSLTFNNNPWVDQMLFDHVSGRFPVGNGSLFGLGPAASVMNFRGAWDGGANYFPADLASQIFYPGDVVVIYDSGVGIITQYIFADVAPKAWDSGFTHFTIVMQIDGVAATWPY